MFQARVGNLISVSLMRIRGVSVRRKSEKVRIGRFRQQTVLRGEQVQHSRASSAAGSPKPQSLTETMGFKPDNKVCTVLFDAGFRLYKAVTLQKR